MKCYTAPFIFKQVYNIDITCNIIFSLDAYLLFMIMFFQLFGILQINDW